METVLDEIAAKLQKIWKSAGISVVSKQRIMFLLRKLHKKRRTLLKSAGWKNVDSYKKQVSDFKSPSDTLFDVAICKCSMEQKCYCLKDVKVKNTN